MIGSLWFNSFSAGGGGAAADYELISTTVLGSSAASVTFSGLGTSAAAYKHLQIRIVAHIDTAGNGDTFMRMNGDTGSNYAWHQLYGDGTSAGSYGIASRTSGYIGTTPGNTVGTSNFSAYVIDILDFASTSKNTTLRSFNGVTYQVQLASAAWLSTAAVTSLNITSGSANFVTGSRFSLYGLKG